MTVTMNRGVSEGLRGGQRAAPRMAAVRGWKPGGTAAWRPAIDISERADAYVVMVEVPGLAADGVEITMEDGLLTIRGERHAAREAAGDKVHRSERGHGAFCRTVTLPSSHVRGDRTEASTRDGVLEILVPKAPEAQAGLIRIRVGQGNSTLTPGHDGEERQSC